MDSARAITILMADDDAEDRMLAKKALDSVRLANDLRFVEDGQELLDYLRRTDVPRPGIVLLDLNMPRKDGREALREIKADPALRDIPVVVLTTSRAEADILRTYELGASSFITKPVTFDGLVEVMRALDKYWFEIVDLPRRDHGHGERR
jgi:CheY-like chemotaxis protein